MGRIVQQLGVGAESQAVLGWLGRRGANGRPDPDELLDSPQGAASALAGFCRSASAVAAGAPGAQPAANDRPGPDRPRRFAQSSAGRPGLRRLEREAYLGDATIGVASNPTNCRRLKS